MPGLTSFSIKLTSAQKTTCLYALCMAGLIVLLKIIQYRFVIRDLSIEFYIGIVAVIFTALGIWAGFHFKNKKNVAPGLVAPSTPIPEIPANNIFGLSKREFDVLALIASGLSNQEIADSLFVSLNTVKTHATNIFLKMDVKRRTQAIHKARELGMIA